MALTYDARNYLIQANKELIFSRKEIMDELKLFFNIDIFKQELKHEINSLPAAKNVDLQCNTKSSSNTTDNNNSNAKRENVIKKEYFNSLDTFEDGDAFIETVERDYDRFCNVLNLISMSKEDFDNLKKINKVRYTAEMLSSFNTSLSNPNNKEDFTFYGIIGDDNTTNEKQKKKLKKKQKKLKSWTNTNINTHTNTGLERDLTTFAESTKSCTMKEFAQLFEAKFDYSIFTDFNRNTTLRTILQNYSNIFEIQKAHRRSKKLVVNSKIFKENETKNKTKERIKSKAKSEVIEKDDTIVTAAAFLEGETDIDVDSAEKDKTKIKDTSKKQKRKEQFEPMTFDNSSRVFANTW